MTSKQTSRLKSLGPILLTIFIDLVGLSVIFPLMPAMLGYYLPKALIQQDTLLIHLLGWAHHLANALGYMHADWMVTVLFGGMVGSLYGVLQFIFAPIWGKLSDSIGRRKVLIFTVCGTGLSYLIWVFAYRFELYILSRVLAGIMAGNLAVANAAVADVTNQENRSKGMAFLGIAFGLGFILGPAIGGLLSKLDITCIYPPTLNWGFTPFTLAALCSFSLALINIIWVLTSFKETLLPSKRESASKKRKNILQEWLTLDHPTINRVLKVNFFFTIVLSGMEFTFVFLAVERFGYTPAKNGMLLVYIGFILMLTQGWIARKGSKRFGEKHILLAGLSIGFLAYQLLGHANNIVTLYAGLTCLGVCVGLVSSMQVSLVSLYANEANQGKYIGLFRGVGALSRALGPISAASIYFYLGSKYCYMIGSFLLLIPLSLALKLPLVSYKKLNK